MITKATPSLILASLLVGIIAGVALSSWLMGAMLVLGAVVAIDLAFVAVKRAPWRDRLYLVVLLALGVAIGVVRYDLARRDAIVNEHFLGTSLPIEATVVSWEGDATGQQLTMGNIDWDGLAMNGRMLVFAPGYPRLQTGQRVVFSCSPERPEPFEVFAYDRYLASKSIYTTCFVREAPFVTGETGHFVAFDRLHDSVLTTIESIFGEPQASLLAGLLMGDNNFSDEWRERFLRTGTSHVVAASGYNVTMLAFVLMAILVSGGLRRQYAYPFVLVGIAGFVAIAGAEAAVTRAGIMGALALTATQLGRKTTPRNIILLTVVVMLLHEPRLLRDDVGFQLSVLSTIGLVTMTKYFSEKFNFIPETFGLRESFAATIAATLATLPIIIFGFGKISIISPFVNLLVLPFVPYAMLTGAIATVIGAFDQSLGAFLAGPAWLLLSAMLEIIEAMAALPFAVMTLPF